MIKTGMLQEVTRVAVALHLKEEVAVGEDSGSEAKSRVWREGSHCPVFDHHLDIDERSQGLRTTLWHYKSTSPLRGGAGSHSFTGAATPGFSTARAATPSQSFMGAMSAGLFVPGSEATRSMR